MVAQGRHGGLPLRHVSIFIYILFYRNLVSFLKRFKDNILFSSLSFHLLDMGFVFSDNIGEEICHRLGRRKVSRLRLTGRCGQD